MVIEYIRYKIPPDRQDEFTDAYRRAAIPLRASPVCLGYELARCHEEPERFVLRIRWTSTEDHLQQFRRSAAFREFFPLVQPFIDDIDEMQH